MVGSPMLGCVAPRAGAWIETRPTMLAIDLLVAPRAGAWIETSSAIGADRSRQVAPRAGAWIETLHRVGTDARQCSRPPRGGVD